jgi:dTDP-4-dehydrorhamnose reductase
MKVLIVGSRGQLGQELQQCCPPGIELVAVDRSEIDIQIQSEVLEFVEDCRPEVIVNAAAYTAVDGAETKPDLAVAVNADGPGHLARAAECNSARLIHVSTDFVFDGEASEPYGPRADTRPLGVYGHSKLAGECRVREILPLDSVILRTAWLYSSYGNNFVRTMVNLMSERDVLRVVDDQVGAPTWARGLAEVIWGFMDHPEAHGIYHWTDAGRCSWCEFAREIQARALALGLLDRRIEIDAIPTSEYPTPARRPAFSVLDTATTEQLLGLRAQPWQDQLQLMLEEPKVS